MSSRQLPRPPLSLKTLLQAMLRVLQLALQALLALQAMLQAMLLPLKPLCLNRTQRAICPHSRVHIAHFSKRLGGKSKNLHHYVPCEQQHEKRQPTLLGTKP